MNRALLMLPSCVCQLCPGFHWPGAVFCKPFDIVSTPTAVFLCARRGR